MLIQEAQQAGEAAGKFNAGEVIIEHVSNSSMDHPLIHLPHVLGIDFSVTKHVLMLWLVAAFVFVVVTWTVRRYLHQDRRIPSGFVNAVGLIPIFDTIAVLDHFVLRTGEDSFVKQLLHGGTTATANFNVTAALAMITFGAIIVAGST